VSSAKSPDEKCQINRVIAASLLSLLHASYFEFAAPDQLRHRQVVTFSHARLAKMLRVLAQQLPKLPHVLKASAPCITQASHLVPAAFTTSSRCVHHNLLLLSLPLDPGINAVERFVSFAAATSKAHGVRQLRGQAPPWRLLLLQLQQGSQQWCKQMQLLLSR
jgi:hypothetical protein